MALPPSLVEPSSRAVVFMHAMKGEEEKEIFDANVGGR